jgi:hypothetical protein
MKDAYGRPTEDAASDSHSDWQCCFCGDTIRERSLEVAITHADGAAQGLRAHVRCLNERLHSSVPFPDVDDEATSTA